MILLVSSFLALSALNGVACAFFLLVVPLFRFFKKNSIAPDDGAIIRSPHLERPPRGQSDGARLGMVG